MFKNVLIYSTFLAVFACKNAPKSVQNNEVSNPKEVNVFADNYNEILTAKVRELERVDIPPVRINYFPNLQAVKDTLNGYDNINSIFVSQDLDYNICIDKFEGKRIGIVSTDNFYILMREAKKDWELMSIDSVFGVKWRGIGLEDINGDGFKDIKSVDGGGGHGLSMAYFHIYNPKTKRFKYNAHFDGFEVNYNPKTKLVQKLYEEQRFGVKARYRVVADSLMIVDNLEYDAHERHVTHTIYKNGELFSSKKITKSVAAYYRKTLWKTD